MKFVRFFALFGKNFDFIAKGWYYSTLCHEQVMCERIRNNIGLVIKKSGSLLPFFGVESGLCCQKNRFLTRVSWTETGMTRKSYLVR